MSPIETFELIAAIAGLIATVPVYKGWIQGALSWNRNRSLAKLKKEKDFLSRLKTSDRYFIGWLLYNVLIVAALFGVALILRCVEIDPDGAKLVTLLHWLIGGVVYFVSIFVLGTYRRLEKYDVTMARIDEKLERLCSGCQSKSYSNSGKSQ